MKASLLLTTYNKTDLLYNTLHSISLQKMSFPLDICILDDASAAKDDPTKVIKQFLPKAKFRKSIFNFGTHHSTTAAFRMADLDSDIFILMSTDIILSDINIIQELCSNLSPGFINSAHVKDIPVDPNIWQNKKTWDKNVGIHLEKWDSYSRVFSGSSRSSGNWLFCVAMLKEDFLKADLDVVFCDQLNRYLGKKGVQVKHLDHLRVFHQNHPPGVGKDSRSRIERGYPCRIRDTCSLGTAGSNTCKRGLLTGGNLAEELNKIRKK